MISETQINQEHLVYVCFKAHESLNIKNVWQNVVLSLLNQSLKKKKQKMPRCIAEHETYRIGITVNPRKFVKTVLSGFSGSPTLLQQHILPSQICMFRFLYLET